MGFLALAVLGAAEIIEGLSLCGEIMPALITKTYILDEIRRTAAENGGKALGQNRFRNETEIKEYDWKAHGARWGDALVEAGFAPNQLQAAISKEELVKRYVELAMELGHLPVHGEIRLKRRRDAEFPSGDTFHDRFGNKQELIRAVFEYCKSIDGFDEVAGWCDEYLKHSRLARQDVDGYGTIQEETFGSVYLENRGAITRLEKVTRSVAENMSLDCSYQTS